MIGKSKLRGPVGRIYPITIISFYVLGVIEYVIRKYFISQGFDIYRGPVLSLIGISVFFFGMGVYQLFRYKYWIYPVFGLILGVGSLHSLFNFVDSIFTVEGYLISIFALALFIVATWPKLYGHERFESNTRRLFKLAIDHITDVSGGFTPRPYSAGAITGTPEVIHGFARFLKSKYIAYPAYREEGVFLLFSLGKTVMRDPDPSEVSYVLFNPSGKMTVHIAAFDYRQYTARYSFEELCGSFGDIFKRFLEYYMEGQEQRILDELKSV